MPSTTPDGACPCRLPRPSHTGHPPGQTPRGSRRDWPRAPWCRPTVIVAFVRLNGPRDGLDHPWYHQAPALLIQRHATPASPIEKPAATPLESPEAHLPKSSTAAPIMGSHPSTRTPFHLLPVLSMT